MKEALVVLTAVEKCDSDIPSVVKELVNNIKDIASQVKVKNIVLYPYAHLSKDLGNPEMAQEILEKVEEELLKRNLKLQELHLDITKNLNLKLRDIL